MLETTKETIRSQLDKILESTQFRTSKRCQSMLRFVVEATLANAPETIRERNIGMEVFQREPGYDTNQDSIVRTTAVEVRKRLAQYYLEPSHQGELRFEIPAGSYAPEFRLPIEEAQPLRQRLRWLPALLGCVALAIGAYLYASRQNELDRFWQPLVDDPGDPVICIEQPQRIYRFTGPRVDELNEKMLGDQKSDGAIAMNELRPTGEQYFSYGDLMASTRLVDLLARKGKSPQLLGDRLTEYHNLRGRPTVLLGQFYNKWTTGLTKDLRYYLDKNQAAHSYEVKDRTQGGKVIAAVSRTERPEDFAIVSRVFDVSTEKTVIAIAATTFYGTIAGADFISNREYIRDALRDAPADWWKRNLQVVLRAPMVNGSPGPPRVIARHIW